MTDNTERLLKAILVELRAIRAVVAPDTREKKPGGAEVTVIKRIGTRTEGMVRESEGDLLPRQLEAVTVEAGPMGRTRRVIRPKGA